MEENQVGLRPSAGAIQYEGSVDAVPDEAVRAFKASLRGELLRPGDAEYDVVRRVWNGMIDRRPGLIARCAGVADVINSVNFARTHKLLVSVRGGGHNVAGNAVCDGGLMIDLKPMKGMRVDPAKCTARAEAGVIWGEFDHESQYFGLATTGGIDPTTGIAGLTLGGGLGWLMRRFGLACDNLLSADVVTADGDFVTASAGENPELFWGIRGGGGNFGIVTSFEYRLHPVERIVGGGIAYPLTDAREVLEFYREYTAAAPDDLTVYVDLLTSDEGVPVVAIGVCYSGAMEGAEQVLAPLRTFSKPMVDRIRPMTYVELQGSYIATRGERSTSKEGQRYWKANFVKSLSDDALDTIVTLFAAAPSPLSGVALEQLGGAVGRVGQDATAFTYRDAAYSFLIYARWLDAAEAKANIDWTREFWEAMEQFGTGMVYVNYLGNEGEGRVQSAYGSGNYERLVALKNKYDPTNFFSMNQNIKPTV